MSTNSDQKELREEKISSKPVYNGQLLDVYEDHVRLPNGQTATREYIKHQGASAVLPFFENGDVMLVRQFRYPLDRIFLEVPAGKIDPDEDPTSTARRELREETGITCGELKKLDYFFPSIGYTDEIIHLYVGWDLEEAEQQIDDHEFLQKHRLPFNDAYQMALDGTITDSKTALLILKAQALTSFGN
jgi:ADP-ribose pyrophosphatase